MNGIESILTRIKLESVEKEIDKLDWSYEFNPLPSKDSKDKREENYQKLLKEKGDLRERLGITAN